MTSHLTCISCDYTLTGLAVSGACPECATPVSHSIDDRREQFPRPEHLRSSRRSLALLLFCALVSMLGLLSVILLLTGLGGIMSMFAIGPLIGAMIIGWFFWQMAWWGLAANDPTLPSGQPPPPENRLAPALALLSFALPVTLAAVYAAQVWRLSPGPHLQINLIIVRLTLSLLPLLALVQVWIGTAIIVRFTRGPFKRRIRRFGIGLTVVRWLTLSTGLIWLVLSALSLRSGRWTSFLSTLGLSALLWLGVILTLGVFAYAVWRSIDAVKRAISENADLANHA